MLLKALAYEAHLKQDSDGESRWDNVQELVNFAASVTVEDEGQTPLRAFLESSALSSDVSDAAPAQHQVTISTCHAAKGLEWPMVFLPASEEGTYPFYRSTTPEQVKEERRLFYVAMTRAETFLYVTWAQRRLVAGEWSSRVISPFAARLEGSDARVATGAASVCGPASPALSAAALADVAAMLGRDAPSADAVDAGARALYVCILTQRRIAHGPPLGADADGASVGTGVAPQARGAGLAARGACALAWRIHLSAQLARVAVAGRHALHRRHGACAGDAAQRASGPRTHAGAVAPSLARHGAACAVEPRYNASPVAAIYNPSCRFMADHTAKLMAVIGTIFMYPMPRPT